MRARGTTAVAAEERHGGLYRAPKTTAESKTQMSALIAHRIANPLPLEVYAAGWNEVVPLPL